MRDKNFEEKLMASNSKVNRSWRALEAVNNMATNRLEFAGKSGLTAEEENELYKETLKAIVERATDTIKWLEQRDEKE
jgi:hypothetical protein